MSLSIFLFYCEENFILVLLKSIFVYLQQGAFHATQIHEISFNGCGLMVFHSDMIKGLEKHLHILDLSNNELSALDANLFVNFMNLQELKTKGNKIDRLSIPPEHHGGLLNIELGGGELLDWRIVLRDIGRFVAKAKYLFVLYLSQLNVILRWAYLCKGVHMHKYGTVKLGPISVG